jgi:ferritin heavy chain
MRGGRVHYLPLPAPESDWKSAKYAMESALEMEKDVNECLLRVHKVAADSNDPQLCDFLEGYYLKEQVETIKDFADLVTQLNRVGGEGLGLYLFDRDLGNK